MLGLLGWAALAGAGYFIVKFTIEFVWAKIDKYFTEKKIDAAMLAEIPAVMRNCKNIRAYEELKKAREKGYTHIMAKTSGGKIDGGVEIYKDTLDTPDPEVKNLLGEEKMAIIER